jgi:DNA-directed RNA polymerase specialized sigma24 family protein
VGDDLHSGASRRELVAARDDLAHARVRYAEAIRAARVVGFSWGKIGRVLGVPKQLLHRRFRHDVN